jgi:PAS domain S-box-containing protein
MAQTHNSKAVQRKMIQDKLQDRYDNLFSGKEELPTDMSIRQVEALKAHVAELESHVAELESHVAELEVQPDSNDYSSGQSSTAESSLVDDLAVQVQETRQDEISGHGDLRRQSSEAELALDRMAPGSWIGTLEQAERAHYLQLASEVSRAVSERMADLYSLLKDAVELIREKFNLYYTQIYLLDSTGHTLVLRAGTGEVGKQLIERRHQLLVNSMSLNGRAANERKAMVVSNTAQSIDFLPNPLLPNTRSEMAVPLLASGQVVGVLDMQSDEPDTLSEVYLPAFETLAGQLAITIQNAALFAEVEQARSEVEAQVHRLTEKGWQDFLDGIERGEKIGFVFNQGKVAPLTAEAFTAELDDVLNVPVLVTGTKVGAIQLKNEPGHKWTSSETELIQVISAQLSQHIENRRLLAQAERYREQAEQVARRLTREGWKIRQTRSNVASGYVYDLNKVEELLGELNDNSADALKQPLLVRDEIIGELSVNTATREDEASEIVAAVAQQLSGHIENLRLTEQTELALRDSMEAEKVVRESEAKLSEALEIAKLANWEYDVERDRFLFNDHFYSIFHTNVKEMGGYELSSAEYAQRLVYPEDLPVVGAAIEKALASTDKHYNTQLEHRIRYSDGEMGYISVEIHIDRDDQGKITRYYGANQDITERKLAEQIVAKRAAELQTVAEVSATTARTLEPDRLLQAVVDITKERFDVYHAHIYLADESWNTLLLAAGAGEIGRQMVATGHSIRMDTEKSLVARAARERQAVIVNDVRDDPAFLPNPLLPETRSEMAVPMIVGDKVLGVFDVQSNITNHFTEEDAYIYTTLASQVAVALQNARLYTEQAATVTQLRELDRLKTSFLANMSHELRTPLNSILGFSDVIIEGLDGPVTEQMDNDLRLIGKNGQHLLHLINDVLDMAKIDAGRMNLQPEKFKLNGLFEEAINITSSLADAKSLSVVIKEDSDQEVEVFADRTRIQQVMINLINNAIKFTEQGGISLSARQAEDHVLIEVHDAGIGIPSEQLQTIFQEFTQVDSSPTRKTGGTGLGLPISRRLVELHGGRLWAESTGVSGEGSTFYVELPLIAKIATPTEIKEK